MVFGVGGCLLACMRPFHTRACGTYSWHRHSVLSLLRLTGRPAARSSVGSLSADASLAGSCRGLTRCFHYAFSRVLSRPSGNRTLWVSIRPLLGVVLVNPGGRVGYSFTNAHPCRQPILVTVRSGSRGPSQAVSSRSPIRFYSYSHHLVGNTLLWVPCSGGRLVSTRCW